MLPAERTALLTFMSKWLSSFQASGAVFGAFSRQSQGQDISDANKTKAAKIIVLDSSFNPPTLAHMRMAVSAIQDVRRSSGQPISLLLLLAVNNADKGLKPAPFPARLALMDAFAGDLIRELGAEAATNSIASESDERNGKSLDINIGLTTKPYFHDKCTAIIQSGYYPINGGPSHQPEQVYLAGFDTLIRIFNPKYYGKGPEDDTDASPMRRALDPFFERARLRITMRTDAEWGSRDDQLVFIDGLRRGALEKLGGRAKWMDRIDVVEGPNAGEEVLSSTSVRNAARDGNLEALNKLVSPSVKEWIVEERMYVDGDE
jgi:nicotinamide-nucleotide adenylyltransferase